MGYGFFWSSVVPSREVALSLNPILIAPLMLLSGMFINSNNVPSVLTPI